MEYTIQKQWKPIVSVVRKITRTKILVLEKVKKKKKKRKNILMLLSNFAVCDKKIPSFIKN